MYTVKIKMKRKLNNLNVKQKT